MKKQSADRGDNRIKKGYNEKNPGQSSGAFPPASNDQSRKDNSKSNKADKKQKEDHQ